MSQKLISIIGGGPVGCLTAIRWARLGYPVEIFERRPDIRKTKISAGRSINLALSLRGIAALNEIGIDQEILSRAVPMYGRMLHLPSGEVNFQRYGLDNDQYINSISRGDLNRALLSYAEKMPNVTLHFQHKLERYALESQSLHFSHEQSREILIRRASVVVGCDGSASALRQSLKALPEFSESEDSLNYGYKELTIPAAPDGSFQMEKNALHIWPRGNHMLIALPNFDGSFTCTLFLPWQGAESFAGLASPADVKKFFARHFSDALDLIENLENSFFTHPTGHMVTVRCGPWAYRDELLLLGDAAHAIVPFFGQGLNCGFEDTSLLASQLETGAELRGIFESFSRNRKTDADAIADLALENFEEMRDKVAQPRFQLEKAIEKKLMQEFPQHYVSRYALVTFSRDPYRFALEMGKIQDGILRQLSEKMARLEDLDLALAEKLIQEKLAGPMAQHRSERRPHEARN